MYELTTNQGTFVIDDHCLDQVSPFGIVYWPDADNGRKNTNHVHQKKSPRQMKLSTKIRQFIYCVS